ncbi:MAG: hypothetical protein ACKO3O_10835, partial [Gammaproteobacteria bacterium]
MMEMRAIVLAIALFAGITLSSALPAQNKSGFAAVDASDPVRLMDSAANILVSELESRRAEFRKDPTKLSALVERVL